MHRFIQFISHKIVYLVQSILLLIIYPQSCEGKAQPCSSVFLSSHGSAPIQGIIFNYNGQVFFLKILFIYFYRRGGEGQREGKKHCWVDSCTPPTSNIFVCGMTPKLLSHTSQGYNGHSEINTLDKPPI